MRPNPISSRGKWRCLIAAAVSVLALAACGGGGGSGGVDTGGTGSYSVGRISGYGSIVVNGVHYEESGARIDDDDGNCGTAGDLKLGMTVAVAAGPITSDAGGVRRATASEIRCVSEIKGPVQDVQLNGGALQSFTVLGQTVVVNAVTVFDGVAPAGLVPDTIVEVYGYFDAQDGRYVATRVEQEDDADEFKLRGPVSNLDAAASTFEVNGQAVSYAAIAATVPGLADGVFVRIELEPAPAGTSPWVAREIRLVNFEVEDSDEAEVEGVVSEYVSNASFKVNGIPVNASSATVEGGAALTNGLRVEVEGSIVNGVLVATRVELEDDDDDGDDDEKFELSGTLGADADLMAKTFVLRGVTVNYASAELEDGLLEAQLVTGARLEVEGVLSADGSTLLASEIELDD